MQQRARIRYYDASAPRAAPIRAKNPHSEFLRTGRIARYEERWFSQERHYLHYAEVAAQTGRRLQAAGEQTHQRLNAFHRSLQFPSMLFHHTLESSPHLGYCHVTAARTSFNRHSQVLWSFYFANFFADIGGGEEGFFEQIDPRQKRMYFAVAMHAQEGEEISIDRSVHHDGLLFRTGDPKVALKNVLMLGARSEQLRKIISAI